MSPPNLCEGGDEMRLLCCGDSNTYGFDPRSYLGGRYPAGARWVDILAGSLGCECLNLGENGLCIPRRDAPPLSGPGERLIIMLGGNDLLNGASAAECGRRMESFLSRRALAPGEALVVAPPPFTLGACVPDTALVHESLLLAREYRAVCARLAQGFADAAPWGVGLCFDGVHFSEEGHRAFAIGIEKAVKAMFTDR